MVLFIIMVMWLPLSIPAGTSAAPTSPPQRQPVWVQVWVQFQLKNMYDRPPPNAIVGEGGMMRPFNGPPNSNENWLYTFTSHHQFSLSLFDIYVPVHTFPFTAAL